MSATNAPNAEKEKIQSQSQLTRFIESSLKIAIPDPEEIKFRGSLLRCASTQLAALKPTFITRLYEAACEVKYPSDEVTDFRKALQRIIGKSLNLAAHRKP